MIGDVYCPTLCRIKINLYNVNLGVFIIVP